jgi:hypothetical protein
MSRVVVPVLARFGSPLRFWVRRGSSSSLTRVAKAWADQGWTTELDETGAGITAPFNAPSQGPPIKLHSVIVTLGTEPGVLTRFRF